MKSNRMYPLLFAALAVAVSPAVAAADDRMKPGAWEMRVNVSTGGTEMELETASKSCFSKAFLDKDPYLTARLDKTKMAEQNAKCFIADEKRTANSASWKYTCTLADGTVDKGTISNRVSALKLKSVTEREIIEKGKTYFERTTVYGSFLGECTKDMPQL